MTVSPTQQVAHAAATLSAEKPFQYARAGGVVGFPDELVQHLGHVPSIPPATRQIVHTVRSSIRMKHSKMADLDGFRKNKWA